MRATGYYANNEYLRRELGGKGKDDLCAGCKKMYCCPVYEPMNPPSGQKECGSHLPMDYEGWEDHFRRKIEFEGLARRFPGRITRLANIALIWDDWKRQKAWLNSGSLYFDDLMFHLDPQPLVIYNTFRWLHVRLKLKNYRVFIEMGSPHMKSAGLHRAGLEPGASVIEINPKVGNDFFYIAAHEMVHAAQTSKGELVWDQRTKTKTWHGESWKGGDSYMSPWEVDARLRGRELADILEKKLTPQVKAECLTVSC